MEDFVIKSPVASKQPPQSPSAEFVQSIVASLTYWRDRTTYVDDQSIADLDRDRQNLFRAVQYGLGLELAWPAVALVALQTVPLVNRRMYRSEWIPILERAIALCSDEDGKLRFDLLIQLGRMQRLELKMEAAATTLQAAESLAREMADQESLARVFYNTGRLHFDQRRYEEAEQFCKIALEIQDALEDSDHTLFALTLELMGRIALVHADFTQAEDYLITSLEVRRRIGDATGIARGLNELASNYHLAGQLDKAIRTYREAERLLAPTSNELDKTAIRLNLGAIFFDTEQWSMAEKELRAAYSPYIRRSGNLVYQAIAVVSLGNVLLKQDRLVEAEAYLRLAIDLWRKVDDKLNLANAVGSLGEVLVSRGEMEEAVICFDEALALLEGSPSHTLYAPLQELFEEQRAKAIKHLG